MKKYFATIVFILICYSLSAQTSNPQQYKYVFTVAKDGTGDYKFIQDAIDAMRVFPLQSITLFIKNGVYNEKIVLPSDNTDVTFVGESVDKTIIVFNDYSGRGRTNTFTSYTAKISGNRFVAENVTFMNSSGPVGQALALYVDADKAVFKNCRFIGNQDTIYAGGENSRQYFVDCYIEGTTDFIFGLPLLSFKIVLLKERATHSLPQLILRKGKSLVLFFWILKFLLIVPSLNFISGDPGVPIQELYLFVAIYQNKFHLMAGITGTIRKMKRLFTMLNTKIQVKVLLPNHVFPGQSN